jgi:hypothetical protein
LGAQGEEAIELGVRSLAPTAHFDPVWIIDANEHSRNAD